jgi:pimeloyl-ACP methyl ester carboxylesterase
MRKSEQKINFDDGVSTTLDIWGNRGPAAICVHGLTSSRKSWERTAAALNGSYRVFAYDQRGHGDSADVQGPMTLQRSVADLRTVAEAIGEPTALIGHSWGGAIVLLGGREAFATKITAVDPMIRVLPGSWRRDFLDDAESDFALNPAALEAELRRRLAGWHRLDLAGKLHAVRHMRAETIAAIGRENRVDDANWDLRSNLAGYPKPLLILAADPGDSVISAEDLQFIGLHGGPNVQVQTFEGQGHNLHRTAFDRYIAATKTFLDRTK